MCGCPDNNGLGLGVRRIRQTIQNVRNWIADGFGSVSCKKQGYGIGGVLRDNQGAGIALCAKAIIRNGDLVGEGNIENAARSASLLVLHADVCLY